MQKQDMIYEDFMEDRAIKMCKDDELNYSVYVQVFTTDNLPFSPITGDKKHIFFDYDQAATDGVAISDVCGNKFNQVTQKYEVTDHTYVVGKVVKQSLPEDKALLLMKKAAHNIIAELNRPVLMSKTQHCHIADYYENKKLSSQTKGFKKIAIASIHKLIRTMYALISNNQLYDYDVAKHNQKRLLS